jgi:hypothetical protein
LSTKGRSLIRQSAAIGYLDIVLVHQGKKPHQTKCSYSTWILYLSTKGRSLIRQRAAIGYLDIVFVRQGKKPHQTKSSYWLYLDIVLVRQWEKSHEICSLLQPTVVEEEKQVSANLQTHILHSRFEKMFKIMVKIWI